MERPTIQQLSKLFNVDSENKWDQYNDIWLSDIGENGIRRHWCLFTETHEDGKITFGAELHRTRDHEIQECRFARMATRQMTAALVLAHMNHKAEKSAKRN